MIPFGTETVTLVQKVETQVNGRTSVSFSVSKLHGCSWRRTRIDNPNENAIPVSEGITCRVPYGQTKPNNGDLLILGDVTVTITNAGDFQRLIESYKNTDGAFVAARVTDNARPGTPMPHYKATEG